MSDQYNGRSMDPPLVKPGSVARARMLAEQRQQSAMQDPRADYPYSPTAADSPSSPASRAFKQKGMPQYEGGAGKIISRPSPMPQYPIPETPPAAGMANSSPTSASYRPPTNRPPQAPQRPPRPSRIPSMVDQARLQEPTPLFMAPVRTAPGPDDGTYIQSPQSSQYSPAGQSRSNSGYISELPIGNPMAQPGQQKKGVILGPPPSSRRGASSFYSTASFVSPIIEESPRSRSHGSYASSSAMPDNWGAALDKTPRMNTDAFYEESVTEGNPESIYDEDGDESRLVKPVELDSTTASGVANQPRSNDGKWAGGAAQNDSRRASWNALNVGNREPVTKPPAATIGTSVTDDLLQAYAAASSNNPADSQPVLDAGPRNDRNSTMRRGLRIDMDAVREAESRGSLTSLPDLIRRATKLAAMIDNGKRPTSRMDNLNDFFGEKQANGRQDARGGRPPSGLSDMLAAFPPPVSTPQLNGGPNRSSSWFGQGGWPLSSGPKNGQEKRGKNGKSKRRCCGMPLWAVIIATLLLLCVIVAAIVVPLELFVFNKNNSGKDDLGVKQCQKDLVCQNGGTNVVSRGTCSCICSGGFTGSDCGTAGSAGCTTTDLVATDGSSTIKNVTLGQSIPRVIAGANSNFSIPLSGTSILAKVNASGLSCIAQNSLVTFNARSARATSTQETTPKARRAIRRSNAHIAAHLKYDAIDADIEYKNPKLTSPEKEAATIHSRADDDKTFVASDNAIDFSRVAVLFVLQEKGVDKAQTAQDDIQSFFTKLSAAESGNGDNISQQDATNVTIGDGGSINLVKFQIDLGNGLVGEKKTTI